MNPHKKTLIYVTMIMALVITVSFVVGITATLGLLKLSLFLFSGNFFFQALALCSLLLSFATGMATYYWCKELVISLLKHIAKVSPFL